MVVNKPKKKKKNSRYSVLYIIMFIIMGTIVAKLLYLQVYKHDDYKEKADVSSTKFISEEAPRGNIYDSDGNIIATNKQTYALTYMETIESTKAFYKTMDKIFEILEENGEEFQDDLALKVDESGNIYFEFKADSESARRTLEIRFKRDRGLNEDIETELFENQEGDYTDEQINQVNDKLMEISAEDTFYYMVESYGLYKLLLPEGYTSDEATAMAKKYKDATGQEILDDLLKEYSIQDIRRYIVIKDAIKMGSYSGYSNITIASNIARETAFIVYQELNNLPGINVTLKPVRYYPYGTLASAVVGYVSSISSSQSESYELRGYDVSTDLIGVSGIESAFEDQLKGTKGGTTVKVNSQGRTTEELFKLESYQGNNVHLTIDKDVQYAAQAALEDQILTLQSEGLTSATRGAVVAIEVNTGRVIAMASYPYFDPNDFAIPSELSTEKYNEYFNPDYESFGTQHIQSTGATGTLDELFKVNEDTGVREDTYDIYPRAMFNYATQGLVVPGSTFKPLTALAGLMDGAISESDTVNDVGIWSSDYTGSQTLENFQKTGHGITDVRKALEVSSNYFFYETAIRLYIKNGGDVDALDSIARYAWKFGLGVEQGKSASTGIQIYENFGQTYNFVSWRKSLSENAKYTIVPALEAGNYENTYFFVPFDIKDISTDPDELKTLKTNLKNNIKETLLKVGTDEQVSGQTEYANSIIDMVKEIMNVSDRYKENLADAGLEYSEKVVNEQARTVSNAISYFIVNQSSEIRSPINIVQDGIGQSMNAFTPLQMANYIATLANGGTRYKVSIVDKITSPDGEIIQEYTPEVLDQIDIPSDVLQAIKEGMRRVNTSTSNATAYALFSNFPIEVAGKTGTADFGTQEQYDYQGRKAYANYISFAPMDNPEIAIFSTIYDGNRGANSAFVHKAIYEAYFKDKLLQINPNYASISATFQKYVIGAPADNKEGSETEEESTIENIEDLGTTEESGQELNIPVENGAGAD
ncbi:penicillin-binding transpeptidase domain-containing protein [Clostridium sp. 1001271B_151109_B4]|uniref:penicillin-binding transpeptidase domain-containing protein n=1 Tax=Clostridium sp. 1001271B_151109_B4 TaxID=2787148 RepID=UPI0018A8EFEB|nr:penicillin-binding transpeptidase domain-containing protein [Clostridium sp. 1001271B_151109_B4]